MDKVYWTNSKNQQIDVDSMDENYLRNTLKMIIKNKTKNGASFDINKLVVLMCDECNKPINNHDSMCLTNILDNT